MTDRDRTVPPGRGRVAAAARAGLFARSGTAVSGLILLTVSGFGAAFGEHWVASARDLVGHGVATAATPGADHGEALAGGFSDGLGLLLPIVLTVFGAALMGGLVPALVARRKKGQTSIPLPEAPSLSVARVVLFTAGAGVMLLVGLHIFRTHIGAVWQAMEGNRAGAQELMRALWTLLGAGGGVLLLVGICELGMTRHALWRALFLDNSQARREQRDREGDRTVRARGLRRARRETGK